MPQSDEQSLRLILGEVRADLEQRQRPRAGNRASQRCKGQTRRVLPRISLQSRQPSASVTMGR